jgi:signal transduction histidine kinase
MSDIFQTSNTDGLAKTGDKGASIEAEARADALERTRLFVTGTAVLAIPVLGVFSYLEFQSGYVITGAMMVIATLLVLLNAWLAQKPSFVLFPTRIIMILASSIILWELFHHGAVSSVFFTAIVPLASIFVFGRNEGLIWSVAMWIAISVLILNAELFEVTQRAGIMIDFTVSYGLVLLLTLGYETLQRKAHQDNYRHLKDLHYEQQRLEDFAAVASDWMYELDADLCFTSISEKWSQTLKIPEGAVLGAPITVIGQYLHNPDERINNAFTAALMEHAPFHDVRFSIQLRGRIIHLTTNGQPVFDASGEFAGYRGTAKDISDIVNSQELIREKEAELMQAQKMEAIGQLTSGVAHDFNNLLTVINGNLELMKLTLEDSDIDTGKIESAMRASDRAAELTNKLLAFARRQPLNPESVNFTELISSLHEMLRRTLGEQIEIILDLSEDIWICNVDVGLFESAILNLAINARDAMMAGGRLTISSANVTVDEDNPIVGLEGGDYVRISLTDTGIGIPANELPHVFEPFYTTKPQGEGSGLGLSMVYGFASQSGGHANITSTPGSGTTANVYLPRHLGTQAAAKNPSDSNTPLTAKKILVIEDEGDVRELVAAMTRTLGHQVESASNGSEAREKLRAWQPDILITDVVLGAGETGPDLAKEAQARYPDLKVLLISGYPEFALESNGSLGASWHLLKKPFGRDNLQASLELLYA